MGNNDEVPKVPELPRVNKEQELDLMIELIMNGVYKDTNLATALHVERHTIADWKKRPEVQDAHRKAILKYSKKRTDTEQILKELEMDIEVQPTNQIQPAPILFNLTQYNQYVRDNNSNKQTEQLNQEN